MSEVAAARPADSVEKIARFVADNPVPLALLMSGSVVAGAAAWNLVRPKGLIEAAALGLFLGLGTPYAVMWGFRRGLIPVRIRQQDGTFISAREALEKLDEHRPVPEG